MMCRLFYIVEECNATSAVFCEETAAEVILCGASVSVCCFFFLFLMSHLSAVFPIKGVYYGLKNYHDPVISTQ